MKMTLIFALAGLAIGFAVSPAFGQGYLCFRPRQVSRIASQIKQAQARKHQDLLATWSKITHHCVSDGELAHLICLKVDTAPSPRQFGMNSGSRGRYTYHYFRV